MCRTSVNTKPSEDGDYDMSDSGDRNRLTVELDDDLQDTIRDARRTEFGNVPKADVVRNALLEYLELEK